MPHGGDHRDRADHRPRGDGLGPLESLRRLGITIAVDDFGTGFSSLSYLHHLPVDTLKIDRTFVRALTSTATGPVLVSHIVGLAHDLGLTVIAEGIENRRQWDRLVEIGAEHGQGFPIGAPGTSVPVQTA